MLELSVTEVVADRLEDLPQCRLQAAQLTQE